MMIYTEHLQREYDDNNQVVAEAIASMDSLGDVVDPHIRHGVPNCMFWPMPDEQVMSVPLGDLETYSPRLYAWSTDRGCAICGGDRGLVVDHCHTTGLVRGLICRECNSMEGTGSLAPYMIRWRSGWNPATFLGIEEECINPFTGQVDLSPTGHYLRMSAAERAAYDDQLRRAVQAI